jgi:alpha-D-xyloside xylohydrolase
MPWTSYEATVTLILVATVGLASCGPSDAQRPLSTERGLTIEADCGILSVIPIAEGALRVTCAPESVELSPSLVLIDASTDVPFSVDETDEAINLVTSRLTATYDHGTGALSFHDASGQPLLEEVPGARQVQSSTVQGEPTLAVEARFHSPPDEGLFGSGQFQDGFLNIRDLPRRLTQVNSQIAIPFLLSSRGYGLLWHNYGMTELNPADNQVPLTRQAVGDTSTAAVTSTQGTRNVRRRVGVFEGEFTAPASGRYAMMLDVGVAMARRYHVEIDDSTVIDFANLWLPPTTSWFMDLEPGEHRVRVEGELNDEPSLYWRPTGSETVLRSPVSEGIDYVVFAGDGLDDVIATYRDLSGEAPLLPQWAYGFIQCRERYHSSDELLANAREFRDRQLPMDVMVQDWQYWGKYGWNAMQWDEEFYPDPADMVRQLHEMNARLMVSVWSKVDTTSTVGAQFADRDLLIPGTDWVDFFNPESRDLYWDEMSTRMLSLGIDAWWQDATEPENDALAGAMTFAGPGERVRLVYPLMVTETVYQGLREDAPDRRAFILTRSAFLGQHRYAAANWSGDVGNDWETLRRQITAGLNLSVTGLPYWTADAGGFFRPGESQYTDPAYHERFLRWLQVGTFSPLMRVHGYQSNTEPWRYGSMVEARTRDLLELRYRLLPYIYSQAAAITFEGSTLMRPLVMDFPNDADAWSQDYEYMFGPSILVAPVVEPGVSEWPVYAPPTPGDWHDWWTEESVAGGTTTAVSAPIERIPLLVRAGSIVPLGPVQQYTGEDESGALELRVYPGADADFTLYEDEGVNYAYEEGARATIPIHWTDAGQTLVIGTREGSFPGMVGEREIMVHLAGSSAATDQVVHYSGQELTVTFE